MRIVHVAMFLGLLALGAPRVCWADEADDLFREAGVLYDAGKFEDAYGKYILAWGKKRSADIAANLAQAEMKTGRKADAATHLGYAIRILPTSVPPEKRKAMEGAYQELVSQLCILHVTTTVDGAAVEIDGKPVGHTPLADAVVVDPGHHVASAQLPEHEGAPVAFDANAGTEKSVTIELRPKAVKVVPPEPTRPIAPAIVGFSLGGMGLAIGIGTLVAANGVDLEGCVATHTCEDAKSEKNVLSNASLWTFVAGGTVAAASAGYLIWALTGPKQPTASWQVVPLVVPGSMFGLSAGSQF